MNTGPFDSALPEELNVADAIRISLPHPILGRIGAIITEARAVVLKSQTGGPTYDSVLLTYRRFGMIPVADLRIELPLVTGWLATPAAIYQPNEGDLEIPDRSWAFFEPLPPATAAWNEIVQHAGNVCRIYTLSGVGLRRHPPSELGARLIAAAAAGNVLGVTARVDLAGDG